MVGVVQKAHYFDPMKQMGAEELFRALLDITVFNGYGLKMLIPMDARISQVFLQMLMKPYIEVKDFRVEFRWVFNSAYIAMQHIHSVEAANWE